MFTTRHFMLLLAVAAMVALVSCGGGISEEEFDSVQNDLETERALAQSQGSQLAVAIDKTASLDEAIDRAQAHVAELESELAKERASLSGLKERVDGAEAEAALLGAFLAWNRKDQEGFVASFTDDGISETALSIPSSLGEPAIALRRVMDTEVSSDTATIHAMYALGTQRHSVRFSMAKQGGVWKIEGEERLSPKIKGDPAVVDLKVDGCAPMAGSETIIEGKVALTIENTGEGQHHLILKKVPENFGTESLLQADGPPVDGVDDVAFVAAMPTGGIMNIAFTESLQPGHYVLACYLGSPKDAEGGQPPADGVLATFTVE